MGEKKKQPSTESTEKSRQYVVWNRQMDSLLASTLLDQMNQGNKINGNWNPQAYHAAVEKVNSTLHLNLTKDNVKNRMKAWKKYYSVVTDVKANREFTWDEKKKMISIGGLELLAWETYVLSNPDASGMGNKVIENWDDIFSLYGKDGVMGEVAETFEEAVQIKHKEVSRKRSRRDPLANAVKEIAVSFNSFVASKKKREKSPPKGKEIFDEVSKIVGLTEEEVYKAVQKFMDSNIEYFFLLVDLEEERKEGWVRFLIK